MIQINDFERKIIARRFPNAYIHATRHRCYLAEDLQVLALLDRLRHPRPRKPRN